jgi:K+-transporting ATPase c subunit
MVDNPKAAILIIAVVSVLAFAVGCVMGSFHVGQEFSEELIPTSLTSSDDMIKPIKETNTTMYNVSIKQPQQKKTVTNYTKKNTTNSSNSSNSNSTDDSVSKHNSPSDPTKYEDTSEEQKSHN